MRCLYGTWHLWVPRAIVFVILCLLWLEAERGGVETSAPVFLLPQGE